MKYNPAFLPSDQLIENFVVRERSLDAILESVRANTLNCRNRNQHMLVVGPRGSGKTMLVNRVVAEIERDESLGRAWYPIVFAEESYYALSDADFWLESFFRLAVKTGDEQMLKEYENLRMDRNDEELARKALAKLVGYSDQEKKRLLFVIENFDTLLAEFVDKNKLSELLRSFIADSRFMLLATATAWMPQYEEIIDGFDIHRLDSLSDEECAHLWKFIAGEPLPADKVSPIRILTGGNARLVAQFARFGASRSFRELVAEFVDLIDEHTNYFKTQLDNMAPQERRIFLALAELRGAATAKEVADIARLDVNTASSQLNRMVSRGKVLVIETGSRTKLYEISDSIFKYYVRLRLRGDRQSLVRVVVEFMVALFGPELASKIVNDEAAELQPETRSDHDRAMAEIGIKSQKPVTDKLFSAFRQRITPGASDTVDNVLDDIGLRLEMASALFDKKRYSSVKQVCQSIEEQYGERREVEIASLVAKAMLNKGLALGLMGSEKEAEGEQQEAEQLRTDAEVSYDAIFKQFRGIQEQEVAVEVAQALFRKGIVLGQLNRRDEEVCAYDQLVRLYGERTEAEIAAVVAKGLVNKGIVLSAGRDAVLAFETVEKKYGQRQDASVVAIVVKALLCKAYIIGKPGNRNDMVAEVAIYDQLVKRYSNRSETAIAVHVSRAMFNKAIRLGELASDGYSEWSDVVNEYDRLIDQFSARYEPDIASRVAGAMLNKAIILEREINDHDKAIAAYDALDIWYKGHGGQLSESSSFSQETTTYDAPDEKAEPVSLQVAKALLNKAIVLDDSGSRDQAIEAYEALEKKFGYSDEPDVQERVAKAMLNKATTFGALHNSEKELAAYDSLIEKYKNSEASGIRLQVVKALRNKGIVLNRNERPEKAVKTFDELVEGYKDSDNLEVMSRVAESWYHKGYILDLLNLKEKALDSYQSLADTYKDKQDISVMTQVAKALRSKGIVLGEMNRHEDAIITYDELIEKYKECTDVDMITHVAKARLNKGSALVALDKKKEAVGVYEELIKCCCNYTEASIVIRVVKAWRNKGVLLGELDGPDIELKIYEELVRSYEERQEPGIAVHVAITRQYIGRVLEQQKNQKKAVAVYRKILDDYAKYAEVNGGNDLSVQEVSVLLMETRALLIKILLKMGSKSDALEVLTTLVGFSEQVKNAVQPVMESFIEVAAYGYHQKALTVLLETPAAEFLEPLVEALRKLSGEHFACSSDIRSLAEEVLKKIESRKYAISRS